VLEPRTRCVIENNTTALYENATEGKVYFHYRRQRSAFAVRDSDAVAVIQGGLSILRPWVCVQARRRRRRAGQDRPQLRSRHVGRHCHTSSTGTAKLRESCNMSMRLGRQAVRSREESMRHARPRLRHA
jgi:hypothetical protein